MKVDWSTQKPRSWPFPDPIGYFGAPCGHFGFSWQCCVLSGSLFQGVWCCWWWVSASSIARLVFIIFSDLQSHKLLDFWYYNFYFFQQIVLDTKQFCTYHQQVCIALQPFCIPNKQKFSSFYMTTDIKLTNILTFFLIGL